jgi:acetyltransferase
MKDGAWLATLVAPTGTLIRFRDVQREDRPLIEAAFRSASRDTLWNRFFSPVLPPEVLDSIVTTEGTTGRCVVGVVQTENGDRIICGARYLRTKEPGHAEIAITVHDDFQGQKVGRFLLELLTSLARADDVQVFEADVFSSNTPMLRLLQSLFPNNAREVLDGGVLHLQLRLS